MCEERGGPERRVFDIIGSDYYADFRIYRMGGSITYIRVTGLWWDGGVPCNVQLNGLSAFLNIYFPAKCVESREIFSIGIYFRASRGTP